MNQPDDTTDCPVANAEQALEPPATPPPDIWPADDEAAPTDTWLDESDEVWA